MTGATPSKPRAPGDVILRGTGISKSFGHVQALDRVDFSVRKGEVVGLVGDNGAGKSTLIKIFSGVYKPDAGSVEVEGESVSMSTPADAFRFGIATIYQDLALVDQRDAAANIFMGREFMRGPFVDSRRGLREAKRILQSLDADIPSLQLLVGLMSGGQRQAVAIAAAIARGGNTVIMDEPTAALGVAESERVLALAEELRSQGKGVVVISHNLEHVLRVADRVTVLFRGRIAATVDREETDIERLVHLIVAGGRNGADGEGSTANVDVSRVNGDVGQ